MKQIRRISSYGVIFYEDYYLLSLLNRGPNKGKYNLVGGAIDFGEDPETTFIREVKEEAGFEIRNDFNLLTTLSELHEWINDNSEEEKLHIIGIIHLFKLSSKLNCKEEGDGQSSDGCKWFHIDELNENIASSMALKAIQIARKIKNEN
jgi:8-oxo-dGTP diphosphatase